MRLMTVYKAVQTFRDYDPDTAFNVNMLTRLIDDGRIGHEMHGSRTVVDCDDVIRYLNDMLEIEMSSHPPHLRTVEFAMREVHATMPDKGVSEVRLRDLIRRGIVPSVRIGNRSYIAMEVFHPPLDRKLSEIEHAPREAKRKAEMIYSHAEEEFETAIRRKGAERRVRRA